MTTGPTVQITSISVLWLVLDGDRIDARAELEDAIGEQGQHQNSVIGTMNHSV